MLILRSFVFPSAVSGTIILPAFKPNNYKQCSFSFLHSLPISNPSLSPFGSGLSNISWVSSFLSPHGDPLIPKPSSPFSWTTGVVASSSSFYSCLSTICSLPRSQRSFSRRHTSCGHVHPSSPSGFLSQLEHNPTSFPWTYPLPLISSFASFPLITVLWLHQPPVFSTHIPTSFPLLHLLFPLVAHSMADSFLSLSIEANTIKHLNALLEEIFPQYQPSRNMARFSLMHLSLLKIFLVFLCSVSVFPTKMYISGDETLSLSWSLLNPQCLE